MAVKKSAKKKKRPKKSGSKKATRKKQSSGRKRSIPSTKAPGESAQIHQGVGSEPAQPEATPKLLKEEAEYGGES
jgi:hypothetical protein